MLGEGELGQSGWENVSCVSQVEKIGELGEFRE